MMNTKNDETPHDFTPRDGGHTSKQSLVDANGVLKVTLDEEAILLNIRVEKLAAEKGKEK